MRNREGTAGDQQIRRAPEKNGTIIFPPIVAPPQAPFVGTGPPGALPIPPPPSNAPPISLRLPHLPPRPVGTRGPKNGHRSEPITQETVGVPGLYRLPDVPNPCAPTFQGVPFQSYNMQLFGQALLDEISTIVSRTVESAMVRLREEIAQSITLIERDFTPRNEFKLLSSRVEHLPDAIVELRTTVGMNQSNREITDHEDSLRRYYTVESKHYRHRRPAFDNMGTDLEPGIQELRHADPRFQRLVSYGTYRLRYQRNMDVFMSKEKSFAGHETIEVLCWSTSYVRACHQENLPEGIALKLASMWLAGSALTQWKLYSASLRTMLACIIRGLTGNARMVRSSLPLPQTHGSRNT